MHACISHMQKNKNKALGWEGFSSCTNIICTAWTTGWFVFDYNDHMRADRWDKNKRLLSRIRKPVSEKDTTTKTKTQTHTHTSTKMKSIITMPSDEYGRLFSCHVSPCNSRFSFSVLYYALHCLCVCLCVCLWVFYSCTLQSLEHVSVLFIVIDIVENITKI